MTQSSRFQFLSTNKKRNYRMPALWTRGASRVIGIMAAILASLHMEAADDLFGTPQGGPRTDRLIAASIQWAKKITRAYSHKRALSSRRPALLPIVGLKR